MGGLGGLGRPHNAAPMTGRAYLRREHAGNRQQSFFNVDGAGCAVHALKHHTGGPSVGGLIIDLTEI